MTNIVAIERLLNDSTSRVISNDVFCNNLYVFDTLIAPESGEPIRFDGIAVNTIEPLDTTITILQSDDFTPNIIINDGRVTFESEIQVAIISPLGTTLTITKEDEVSDNIVINDTDIISEVPLTIESIKPKPGGNTLTITKADGITPNIISSDISVLIEPKLVLDEMQATTTDITILKKFVVGDIAVIGDTNFDINNRLRVDEIQPLVSPLTVYDSTGLDPLIISNDTELIVSNPLFAGSGIPTVGITEGVVQVNESDSSLFGIPTDSFLLYSQIGGLGPYVKTSEPASISLNRPSYIQAYQNNGIILIPSGNPDFYKIPSLSITDSYEFTLSSDIFTYTGIRARKTSISMTISILSGVGDVMTIYAFKNATYDGANLLTSGISINQSQCYFGFDGLTPVNVSTSFLTDLSTGDTISFAISRALGGGNLVYSICSVNIDNFSKGTD